MNFRNPLCAALLAALFMSAVPANAEPPQTEFAFNLYRTIVKDTPNENVMISPYGVQHLLDLARTGADGKTKTEIEQVLGYTELVKWESLADGTLTTAAALWVQKQYPILPEFLQTAREKFGSSIEQADFRGNPKEAVKLINAWGAEKTKGKIPTILDDIDEETRLVLINAIHFAADWKVPFEGWLTRENDFTLQDGTKVKTEFMQAFDEQKMYSDEGDTLGLGLRYKDRNYAMVLLLPKQPSNFAKWESAMTLQKLNLIRRSMKETQVNVRMPKFKMENSFELTKSLKQLGMTSAFALPAADFSKMTTAEKLFVSTVLQKTYIRVDELGTEAAAVTAMAAARGMLMERPRPKEFYADRPFLYAIFKGNTILFLGRFVKPIVE